MNTFTAKIRSYFVQAALLICLSFLGSASAYAAGFAIDAHGGSNGAGLGGTIGVNSFFNVRLGLNQFEYSDDFEGDDTSDVDYDGNFEFDNQYVKLDYHPFAGSFRITLGIYSNNNELNASGVVDSNTTIGEGSDTITFNATGRADLSITYDSSTASYIGIGFGNAVRGRGGLGFSVDLGIIDTGAFSTNVTLDTDAENAAVGDINRAINAEIDSAIEEYEDFDIWPLFQIGISYGF